MVVSKGQTSRVLVALCLGVPLWVFFFDPIQVLVVQLRQLLQLLLLENTVRCFMTKPSACW